MPVFALGSQPDWPYREIHSTPTQHTDACTDLYGLTAFGLVCAVHTIDRHVAAMVWGDTVGLVPHVLAA